jgi:SAM-dependent methyltransferase
VTSSLHSTFSGSIPEYYDRYLGPLQFGPFARELAALLPADPGGDVLEIACGTGLVTRELRRSLVPLRRLVATDFNKPMLDHARGKLNLPGIEWREADGTHLPFGDAEFSAVVSGFGVMFMPDKPKATSEARRVLRAGGVYLFSTWDRIEENTCSRVYAETIESLFPDDEEMHFRLPWSMHDEGRLRKLLADAGFSSVAIERRRVPVEPFNPRDIATGQVRGTPRGLLLEKRGMTMDAAIDRVAVALEKVRGNAYGQALLVLARA